MSTCSVIVPTWNRAKLLPKALASIYGQDSCPWDLEVIVIDDGSTDGTVEMVKQEWGSVKLIELPRTGKPGLVRNAGIEQSTGEFIAYLDSDDFWLPHHLVTANAYFERNPTAHLVSNHWMSVHRKGNILKPIRRNFNPTPNTNCHVHRRGILGSLVGFNEKQWGEDGDFFGQIAASFFTIRTGVVTSVNCYVQDGNNITYHYCPDIKSAFR